MEAVDFRRNYLAALQPLLVGPEALVLDVPGIYTFLNPHSYLIHRKSDPSTLLSFDRVFVDGIALVALLKICGIVRVNRAAFDMTSLAPPVFEEAAKRGLSTYFVGTEPHLVGRAVRTIVTRFPKLQVAGYRHGFFADDAERQREQDGIVARVRPDIVIVGMGAPLQEQFLLGLRARGWRGLGFTCGGFLEQTAWRLHYFPAWINRWHLRWLFRISTDSRKLARFLRWYPSFVPIFLADFRRYVIRT